MTYSFGRGIPKNSILRQGTLIVGVTKRDPIAPAVQSLEEELQKSIAERNGGTEQSQKSIAERNGGTEQSQKSKSTVRKPDETG